MSELSNADCGWQHLQQIITLLCFIWILSVCLSVCLSVSLSRIIIVPASTYTRTHARTHAHTHTHTRTQTSKQAGAPFTKLDLTSYMHVRQNDHQSVWHMSWRAFNSTDWRCTMCVCVCVCVCVVECCINCTPWLNYTHTHTQSWNC